MCFCCLVLFLGVVLFFVVVCFVVVFDVLEFMDDNFESCIFDMGFVGFMFVEFFVFWCGYCKRFVFEYEVVVIRLKGIVLLVKVDCIVNINICNKYGVSGYLILKIFRDGEEVGVYDGFRIVDGIVSYLKKQVGLVLVFFRIEEEFKKFISDKDVFIVGFFDDLFSEVYFEFLKVVSNLRDNY